jgi:transcriptional regulator with XRE-family HTH domain
MDEFASFLQRVGENIKRLRKLNELTQTDLAEKTNRPQSSIARVETATYEDASLSILYQLSNALGVSLSDLMAIAEGK